MPIICGIVCEKSAFALEVKNCRVSQKTIQRKVCNGSVTDAGTQGRRDAGTQGRRDAGTQGRRQTKIGFDIYKSVGYLYTILLALG
jgi:hypothetical protein